MKKVITLLVTLSLLLSMGAAPMSYAAGDDGPIVAVYFPSWSVYSDPDRTPELGLHWANITTVNHAFWQIVPPENVMELLARQNPTGFNAAAWQNNGDVPYTIRSTDPVADLGGELTPGRYFEGHFSIYERMAFLYPDIDIMISVGGWTDSGCFSLMSYYPESRKTFIDSCIDTMKTYPWLAGIDLDWEYPGSTRTGDADDRGNELAGVIFDGLTNAQANTADRNNFTALLVEMRAAFDAAFPDDHKQITFCASSGGNSYIDHTYLQNVVDRINIMNYDGSGGWSSSLTHHTSSGMIESSLNRFTGTGNGQYGIDPAKLTVGAVTYSHAWNITARFASTGNNGLANGGGEAQFLALKPGNDLDLRTNDPANATTPGTTNSLRIYNLAVNSTDYNKTSNPEYNEILNFKEEDGWIFWHDPTDRGVLAFNNNPASSWYGVVVSYDDLWTMEKKVDLVKARGVAGFIFWDADGDTFGDEYSITRAAGLGMGVPLHSPRAAAFVSITGPASVVTGANATAEYTVSAELNSIASGVELEFEVDGNVLSSMAFSAESGLSFFGDGNYGTPIHWTNIGNRWIGKVTLINVDAPDITGLADILTMEFNVREGALGVTDVKLNYIKISYKDGEIATMIVNDTASTALEQYYSPYDLNKDGVIDLNDITYALQFLLMTPADPEWDEAKACDYNNDNAITIADLILILTNYTVPYYN